ncbi:MAG TPA: NADPH-dependent glutamate synthase [Bacillota bacterium]|nr:NADPH-dependent glutamate synthase [Bacillota bacterium]
MIKDRIIMQTQDPLIRNHNFNEVALGFSENEAILEASRCLQCKNPTCIAACPASVKIPDFIRLIKEKNSRVAYDTIYKDNVLPAVCGRVCPQESQCEGACVLNRTGRPIAIGALERYVGDESLKCGECKDEKIIPNGKKVAVVGSGPAGLANAASLRRMGYDVDIYEALHEFGGVLQYGIPAFRLPKTIVESEVLRLEKLGIKFHKNVIIGKSLTIDQMKNELGYDAIFVGTGAGLPKSLGVPGEGHSGVFSANEFLIRVNLMKATPAMDYPTPIRIGDNVAVIGGGNVAMDAARVAKRLGAKNVFILYRRDKSSLPARLEEVIHAEEEGIIFKLLHNPVEFIGENHQLKAVRCEKMELGELDSSGRAKPVGTGQYETFPVDSAIVSIGENPNPIISKATPGLETDRKGQIVVNNHQTSIAGVFAGGDVVIGAATVILAIGEGKDAAIAIDEYLKKI